MLYYLLCPYSERGWNINRTHERETNGRFHKVTRLQYAVFRTTIQCEFTLLHNLGKSWLQYLIDHNVHDKGEGHINQRIDRTKEVTR